MKNKGRGSTSNVKPYDYGRDFKVLSKAEQRGIIKTARNLLKQQRENTALLTDTQNGK